MYSSAGVVRLPVRRLHMELTNICNFSCRFCPDSGMTRARGYMSPDMARAIFDQVSRQNLAEWIFLHVMGEPTLHPELVDIVRYGAAQGLRISMTTNGSMLDIPMVRALEDAGLRQIMLSLQTPDRETFAMRQAGGLSFDEYAAHIRTIAGEFMDTRSGMELVIGFLSSPLRRLILPVAREFSIADTSSRLRGYLCHWAELIIGGTHAEKRLPQVMNQIRKARCYRENRIRLTESLSFYTRILGDWATHFNHSNVRARFGKCPAIQDNFGILWNGDYVYCCTDYDGRTSSANFSDKPVMDFLLDDKVQDVVRGFQGFRVIDPHCQECIGDSSLLRSFVKQAGSIIYFSLRKQDRQPDRLPCHEK